jgi:hypothetical protein
MRTKNPVAAFVGIVLLAAPSALAGESGGRGGGIGLLCYKSKEIARKVMADLAANTSQRGPRQAPPREVNLQLESLRASPIVLDLYEARLLKGVRPLDPVGARPNLTRAAEPAEEFRKIHDLVWERVYRNLMNDDKRFWMLLSKVKTRPSDIRNGVRGDWVSVGTGVLRNADATFTHPIPEDCAPVQFADFDDVHRQAKVDSRILALLDDENRVTLWVHEDVGHFYRTSARQAFLMSYRPINLVAHGKVDYPPARYNAQKATEWKAERVTPPTTVDEARRLTILLVTFEHYQSLDFKEQAKRVALSLKYDEKQSDWTECSASFEYTETPAYISRISCEDLRKHQGYLRLDESARIWADL